MTQEAWLLTAVMIRNGFRLNDKNIEQQSTWMSEIWGADVKSL